MFLRIAIPLFFCCAYASTGYAGQVVINFLGGTCLEAFEGSSSRTTITTVPSSELGSLPEDTSVTVTFQADPGYIISAFYWGNGDIADLGDCSKANISNTIDTSFSRTVTATFNTGTWFGHAFGAKAVRVSRVNPITIIGSGRVLATPVPAGLKFRWDKVSFISGEHTYYICAIPATGWYVYDWILRTGPTRGALDSQYSSRIFTESTFNEHSILNEVDNSWEAGLVLEFRPLPDDPIVHLPLGPPPPLDGTGTFTGGAGTNSSPIVGINNAVSIVADGSILGINPGSTSETVTIDRPMTLTVNGTGVVVIGAPEVMTRKTATSGFVSSGRP